MYSSTLYIFQYLQSSSFSIGSFAILENLFLSLSM
nr:MAG TPA: hypothetical protein [Caudoviricetes sp.]